MAYTNGSGQTRIGVRIVPLSVVIPTISALLDSYSGAAAAYSLRKLKSSYTGSAIRVRRSSDNTEMNIGFDSDGNLDTYALSSFVGTGNGFVSIWYDQSGSYNLIQTTAANQPSIILSGSINTQNGKPVLITDGSSFMVNNSVSWSSTTNSIFATIKLTSTRGYVAILSSVGTSNQHFVSRNVNGTGRYYDSGGQEITAAALPNGFNLIGIHENTSGVTVFENGSNLVTNFAHDTVGTLTGIVVFRRDNDAGNVMRSDSGFSELVIYGTSKLSDNSVISNNINTYYSAYPNPTSVWNLLNAVYSADTIASSSLKTSLFASYNGESNTNDSFGTNNGTAQGGLTYTTGKIGNAFSFNGTNAYVSLPNTSGQFNFTGDFSVSAWINTPNYTNSRLIFTNYVLGGTYGYGILLYHADNNIFSFELRNGNTIGQYQTSAGITTNSWNHITFVRKVGQAAKIYLNGVLISGAYSLGNSSITPSFPGTQIVNIGSHSNGSGLANYKQDATTIWQKELTISEITELYNSGNGTQYIGDNFYKPTTNDALNTYNGTAQGGLTYGVGKVGTAFQFNGTNAFIKYPANSMSFTGDFSISVWVNIPSGYIGTNSIDLLTNITMPYWYNSPKGFWFRLGGGSLSFALHNGTTTDSLVWNDTQGLILKGNSGWINIVATRKSSTRSNIYVNGVLKASNTSTFNPAYSLTNQTPVSGALHIVNSSGSVVNNDVFAPNGTKIDSLSVWQKELTQADVTELYNSGNGKQYPN